MIALSDVHTMVVAVDSIHMQTLYLCANLNTMNVYIAVVQKVLFLIWLG